MIPDLQNTVIHYASKYSVDMWPPAKYYATYVEDSKVDIPTLVGMNAMDVDHNN